MDAHKLMELIRNKKQALKERAKTIKPNPGANRYVILPTWRTGEEIMFWHDFGQHYIKNVSGEIQAVHPCPQKTYNKPCSVCEALSRAAKLSFDDETVNALKESFSKQSYLLNVLALDSDDSSTPQILELGKLTFKAVLDSFEQWGAALFDPHAPQVIVINRDGKGMNTKYTVQVSPKTHPLPSGVLSKLNDLDEYVRQGSEEQERRAISAINSIAGLLPPPDPSADKPRTTSAAIEHKASTRNRADDDELDDLLESTHCSESRREAELGKAADIALDDELDDLLMGLTGTDD